MDDIRTDTIDCEGYPLTVTYIYYPATYSKRETGGLPLAPEEPAQIEIQTIWINGVNITGLVEHNFEHIEQIILSNLW